MNEKGTKNEEIIGFAEVRSTSGTGYTLFFTSDNILVTEAPHQRLQLAVFGITWLILTLLLTFIGGDFPAAAGLSFLIIIIVAYYLDRVTKKKLERVEETPESTIRKYKRKCAISYSDIAEIQMEVVEREEPPFPFLEDKPELVQKMKMNVVTDERTHGFFVGYEKQRFNEAVNLLSSVLPDKLSVSDQGKLAKKLKDQLRELDDQLSKGSITLEEHKAKKKKLRWELGKLIAPVVQHQHRLKKKHYALFFAPERVILAWIDKSIREGLRYEYRDELARMSPDAILRAHERSFAISYPDIADVEIMRNRQGSM